MKALDLLSRICGKNSIKLLKIYPKEIHCCSVRRQSSKVRVRFAPSPTGLLHLGGFRTALLNYLFALKENGVFVVRIEDTDQTRLVQGASDAIEDDLKWLGIHAHESPSKPGAYGPYCQSKRLGIYEENVKTIIDSGHAYECFCSEKRIDLIRKDAVRLRQRPRYDNKCRDLTRTDVVRKKAAGEKFCIRFKMEPEARVMSDLVGGSVTFDTTGYNYEGDPIIIKTDGYPTYHFANIVDDHFMEISHVLRGVEWQVSTPKHLQMYEAFGWKPPQYAHLPLIMNKDGTKLSKRQGDISIGHYRESMYYPLSLVNFVTKSGGGFQDHGVEKIYNFEELAEMFSLSTVHKHDCKLDFVLLSHLNQLELRNQIGNNFSSVVQTFQHLAPTDTPIAYIKKVIEWCPERIQTLKDLLDPQFAYLWSKPSETSIAKISMDFHKLRLFTDMFSSKFSNCDLKDKETISSFLRIYSEQNSIKQNILMRDLRLLLCGLEKGPPMVEIFSLFGFKMTCDRLENAINVLKETSPLEQKNTQ